MVAAVRRAAYHPMRAPHQRVTGTPPSGAPVTSSWNRIESEALPHPSGRTAIALHIAGDSLADAGPRCQSCGRGGGMVAGSTDIDASQLVAFAARHPVQRQ